MRARNVTVSLDRSGDRLVRRVTDDGRGFVEQPTHRRSGLRLVSLRERVRMLGGTLEIPPRFLVRAVPRRNRFESMARLTVEWCKPSSREMVPTFHYSA